MNRNLALAVLLPLFGCMPTVPATTQSTPADDAAIRALEEQERLAVLNQDVAALERLWADEFMVNSPLNQIAPNRAIVVNIMRQGLIHYSSFNRTIEQLRTAGNVAIVMGAETVQPTGNAPMAGQTVQRRFTHIWQRNAGTWRLIARHANNIPPT
jgi:ketosteroid isomerase-like protein